MSKTRTIFCRICLSEHKNISGMKKIDSLWSDNLTYLDVLQNFCGEQCNCNPDMPIHLCKKCIKKLINSHLFKLQCIEAESKWLKLKESIESGCHINKSDEKQDVDNLSSTSFGEYELNDNCKVEKSSCENYTETTLNCDYNAPIVLLQVKNECDDFIPEGTIEDDCLSSSRYDNEGDSDTKFESKSIDDVLNTKHSVVNQNSKNIKDEFDVPSSKSSSDSDYFIDKQEEVQIPKRYRRKPPKYKKSSKYITCLKCNIKYNSRREYNNHFSSNHSRKTSLCQDCGKIIAAANLNLHRATHLEDKDRKLIKCEICNKGFKTRRTLGRHRIVHTGERKYECKICHEKFKYWQSRLDHMISNHSNPEGKSYSCKFCDKVYQHYGSLHGHILNQHNENCHQCKVCSKMFTNSIALYVHQKTHQDRQFTCDECGKKFREKKKLENHKKHHSGELNYECEVCLKRYVDAVALRRHLRYVHPGHPLPPPRSKEFAERFNIAKTRKISEVT